MNETTETIVEQDEPAVIETPPVVEPVPIGIQLREQREARGLSVEHVARTLKLQPRQIAAAEENDFSAIGGKPFQRGFLRNYARCVGFDPAEIIASLDEKPQRVDDVLHDTHGSGVAMPQPGKRKSLAWLGAVSPLLVVAVVGVILYFAGVNLDNLLSSFRLSSSDAPSNTPVVTTPVVQPATAEQVPAPKAPDTPAQTGMAAAPGTQPVVAPAAVPAPGGGQPAPVAPVAPAAIAVPAPVAPPPAPVVPANTRRVAVTVQGESWVEIKSEGRIFYSQKVAAGQSCDVQGKAPFAIVIGNAKGAQVRYDGQEVDLAPHTKVNVTRLTLN